MPVTISADAAKTGFLKVHLVGDATVAGLLGQVANPEGVLLQIVEGWIYFTTAAGAASTMNVGIAAAGVDNAQLLSGFPGNSAAGTCWTVVARAASEAAATGTQSGALWPAADFLTVTNAANASTGMVADLYLKYIRLA
jgi:hypothetical protein